MALRKSPSVLYVATFPPRECGIATFTQDLTNAIDKELAPQVKSRILAMNANGLSIYNYPGKVAYQIRDNDLEDYLTVANKINRASDIKLINIQHEYGIFGGNWGNYLLPFMAMVKKPIVVTFHTVLPRPDKQLKKITQDIIAKAAGIVVMTHHAERLLRQTYQVEKKKPIAIIPHGVHHIPFPSKTRAKQKLNLSGQTILSTFGMLNRDKGLEYAIEALPPVVAKHPDVLYLILGATHPVVVRQEGERYRNKLIRLVKKLGLEEHVKFYNKYLDLGELIEFLKATDIYVSPTLNPQQAVSGTISYALSCACPIISTANQYAQDVINRERGLLVDFANAPAISKALEEILADRIMRSDMKKATYYYSRHMTWPNVALSYYQFFNRFAKIAPRRPDKLPEINLHHLKTLTDDLGIIQFARHTKPDRHSGYCLDDNARALIGTVRLYQRHSSKNLLALLTTYFNYVAASQIKDGQFNDFINYDRTINRDQPRSEDSFGRALWALGVVLNSPNLPAEIKDKAHIMFKRSLKRVGEIKFSRALAFSLLGLYEFWQSLPEADSEKTKAAEQIKTIADELLRRYDEQLSLARAKRDNWQWFDDHLAYSNYKIPEALFKAYQVWSDKQYLEVAKSGIDWLSGITFDKGYYNAIGQDGWYFRSGKRAYFDQQPEDAASAVEALLVAYKISGLKKYADQAQEAFAWFLGKNHLSQMVYDEATGGCYDGLGKHSLNFNQGAESTISYFLARLAIEVFQKIKK
jgi:glycosyltransferase involved in cell wall biosynthesis